MYVRVYESLFGSVSEYTYVYLTYNIYVYI